MAEDDTAIEERIRAYLADSGGSLADPSGRTITNDLARAIGVDKPQLVSVALGQMESDGVITRETRGLRTYRISLAAGNGGGEVSADGADEVPGAAPEPAGKPVPASDESSMDPPDQPPPPMRKSVSLREAIAAAKAAPTPPAPLADAASVPPPSLPAAAEATPPPAAAEPDVEVAAPAEDQTVPVKALSLREAIAATKAATPPESAPIEAELVPPPSVPEPVGAPPVAVAASPVAEPPVAEPTVTEAPPEPTDQPLAGTALSLRDAIAASKAVPYTSQGAEGPTDEIPAQPDVPSDQPKPKGRFWRKSSAPAAATAAAGTAAGVIPPAPPQGAAPPLAPPPPLLAPVPPPQAPPGPPSFSAPGTGPSAPPVPAGEDGDARQRRLRVPIPEVKTAPTRAVLAIVGAALAVLVIIAVVTVILSRKTSHAEPVVNSAVDACQVVTPADAAAVFGKNPGSPHYVLGDCVYDNGTQELIVGIARQNAKTQFDNARTTTAKAVPGIGDAAFFLNGELWVLKGNSVIQITLGPTVSTTPNAKVLALASAVAARLS